MALATRPIESIVLQNFSLDLKLLPPGTDSVTFTTLTCPAGALEGATTISVTATAGVNYTIAAGTSLSFAAQSSPSGRQHVLLLANATLAGTTAVSLTVAPLFRAIPANATSRLVQDMFPLQGLTNMTPQFGPVVVDTTNNMNGSGTSSAVVRVKREITFEGTEFRDDQCLMHFIKAPYNNPVLMNRPLWAIATLPTGERYEGVAKTTALTMPVTVQEVMKYTGTLEFQGEISWLPGYYATGGSSNGFPAYNL